MTKNLLNQFAEYFEKSEEFQQRFINYQRFIESKEGEFFKDMLLAMKGVMANHMFSHNYTNLEPTEKDVIQKTYYNIDQILIFLVSPLNWLKKKESKWKLPKLGKSNTGGNKDG